MSDDHASESTGGSSSLSYMPALDGVRALAVLGVMAYHSGIPFLPAGFLGVDTFFVLSGFLITTLLLGEWRTKATIRLGAFWARRARRLLPALLLVLLFVSFYASMIAPQGKYPNLRLDGLASLFYVANWHFILTGGNYFVQTGSPSLLTHTWSLAIEEQFYLVWPLVVFGVMWVTRRLWVLFGVCVLGAIGSATEMALLYNPRSPNLNRLYYGTDTHAQCLLVGAAVGVALAMVAERRRERGTVPVMRSGAARASVGDPAWLVRSRGGLRLLGVVGGVGFLVSVLLWWRVTRTGSFLWRGGFMVAAVSTAAVLVCVICAPRSWLSTVLSVRPLRFIGRISYGMYLWHYPLFQWIDATRTGLRGSALFGVRCAVTLGVSVVSFVAVERPIRQGTFFRQWRAWVVTPVVVAGVVVALLAATSAVPAMAVGHPGSVPNGHSNGHPDTHPVRVLLVGDSTALTLGIGLSNNEAKYDIEMQDEGVLGCGVTDGGQAQLLGVNAGVATPCTTEPIPVGTPRMLTATGAPDAERWTVFDKSWVKKFDPNVVMLLAGRWEVTNRTYDGKWTNILQPAFAGYVKRQLDKTVNFLSAKGARVVLLTAPCYFSGTQPDGSPWPEDSSQRLAVYNRLVREVASAHPGVASVINLNAMLCPDGKFEQNIGTVQVRWTDGVHITVTGGEYLAPRILPTVERIGKEQRGS